MWKHLKIAFKMALATLVVVGVIYPLAVTAVAQIAFPWRANGSLIVDGSGKVVGSALLAQKFDSPKYFHPRPSAVNYDAAASGGSNLGPTNKNLKDRVAGDIDKLRESEEVRDQKVPVDAVTTSGSGLDPDITPANAQAQIARVAAARGMNAGELKTFVDAHITPRQFGFLGEPRVNVLALNLALDQLKKP